jgi:hypothetical protein
VRSPLAGVRGARCSGRVVRLLLRNVNVSAFGVPAISLGDRARGQLMVDAEDDLRPARNYSWAPFAKGHELSTRHGAFSDRRVAPRAAELIGAVLQIAAAEGSTVPYLADATYQPALTAWARAEAQQDLLEQYLDNLGGPIDERGKVRPAADLLERVARRAERMRTRLGLDPLARGSLARDLAMAQSSHELDRLKVLGQALLDATHDAEETTAGEGGEVDHDD